MTPCANDKEARSRPRQRSIATVSREKGGRGMTEGPERGKELKERVEKFVQLTRVSATIRLCVCCPAMRVPLPLSSSRVIGKSSRIP